MLTKNLAITYSMVWSIAIANIVGSGLCYVFSSQFAKLASLRYTLILPVVLSLVYIGAFEGHRSWGDMFSLLFFGVFAWAMKHFKWPRPPLVLGFILGSIIERYMFISIQRYGGDWMLRPLVLVLFLMAALTIIRPFLQDVKAHGGFGRMLSDFHGPRFSLVQVFPIFMICLFGYMLIEASSWNFAAKIIPMIVGAGGILFCAISLFDDMCKSEVHAARAEERAAAGIADEKMHMDIGTNITDLSNGTILLRGAIFFGYLIAFLISMFLIGIVPTVPIFIIALMRIEGPESWKALIPMAICMTALVYGLFDQLLTIPWPPSLLGQYWPWWKTYMPSS